MCTPQRYSIVLGVNVYRTRDLQIFNLLVSQLSYPRNVVMTDLISKFYISFRKHRFMVFFMFARDHGELF